MACFSKRESLSKIAQEIMVIPNLPFATVNLLNSLFLSIFAPLEFHCQFVPILTKGNAYWLAVLIWILLPVGT
ncbi:hypothetical protein Y032_0059g2982 [Ancylostoma ceylanicum]|uniref:Uncharacterized protein n=1 Tax=Ancylostoma ceylanicum TaxID=53326 RepID=A0A016U2Z3_9BILA|nr:hypothetical protein Y032_0059g2982 [Ancylostoma ceylanicum]